MRLILKKPDHVAGSAVPAIIVGCFVAFGGVLFGYDTGTIGGILGMHYWREHFSTGYINPKDNFLDVTASQSSEIVAILSAGTFFGALASAPIADLTGRRFGMMVDTVVFTLGVILQTAAVDIPLFVAGRFFAGFGVGLLSATSKL
jgi:SP family sugar:H+ symporter-like MFS transporter